MKTSRLLAAVVLQPSLVACAGTVNLRHVSTPFPEALPVESAAPCRRGPGPASASSNDVVFTADPQSVQLQMQTPKGWSVVCRGACAIAPTSGSYRVGERGRRPTDPFSLRGGDVVVAHETRAPALEPIGGSMVVVGTIAFAAGLIGGISNADAPPNQATSWPEPVALTGGVFAISGMALLGAALFMNPPWKAPNVDIVRRTASSH